jgi:hypothetical protein
MMCWRSLRAEWRKFGAIVAQFAKLRQFRQNGESPGDLRLGPLPHQAGVLIQFPGRCHQIAIASLRIFSRMRGCKAFSVKTLTLQPSKS